jgi:hypothetical protein
MKRFEEQSLNGPYSRGLGQVASFLIPPLEACNFEAMRRGTRNTTSIHWSTRRLGEQLCMRHMKVAWV